MSGLASAIYGFIKTRQPDGSGAATYAFAPKFTLPLFTLPGPGVPVRMNWRVTQPEQLYYKQTQQMIGLAGTVAGQIAMQPLVDNRGITG